MLQEMRQYTKSWLSWLFVVPLVISFAAWGIGDMFKPSTPDTVATVGGTDISVDQFQRQYRLQIARLGRMRNEAITPDMSREMGVPTFLLDTLTRETALGNLADQMHLGISDARVVSEIKQERDFTGPLGTFDKPTFDQKIAEMGFTEPGFLVEVRRILVQQQLTMPLMLSFQTPGDYVAALMAHEAETRAVEYVVLTPAMIPPVAPPSDAVLAAYLKAHSAKYSTPEYRDITFAYIAPSDVMSQVNVTPAQIKQIYDANTGTYNVPETRDLEQLSFKSQADAQSARAKIDSGQSFAQVAASLGKKESETSIGTLAQSDLTDARGPAAFALPKDGTTQPVQSASVWYLIHVANITAGKSTSLEQATPDIRQKLLEQTADAKIGDITNAAQDAVGTGADIQEIAAKSGMHFAHVAAMDRSGLGPNGAPIAAPNDDQFRSEAFKAEVGDIGDPETTKSGLAFIVKVNGVTPPKVKSLDSIRAQVLADWTTEQQAAQLKLRAQKLAAEATEAHDMSLVSEALSTKVLASPALKLSSHDDTFSPQLVATIFNTPAGAATSGPISKGEGYVIARVSGIHHDPIDPQSMMARQASLALSQQMSADVASTTADAAKDKQGVKLHQDVVNGIVGGENS
jgi:peptidyl-prolyl cis-trans isomerase D